MHISNEGLEFIASEVLQKDSVLEFLFLNNECISPRKPPNGARGLFGEQDVHQLVREPGAARQLRTKHRHCHLRAGSGCVLGCLGNFAHVGTRTTNPFPPSAESCGLDALRASSTVVATS
jgi:hypothetical protein